MVPVEVHEKEVRYAEVINIALVNKHIYSNNKRLGRYRMAHSPETQALRQLIQHFIDERLQAKLDKLKPDEEDKRASLLAAHHFDTWLTDAARRVTQIQLASHTLKPIHPDARGSSLHSMQQLDTPGLVGTHSITETRADDVVGNAAALDVFKLLNLQLEGRSLLSRVLDDDSALQAAWSDDVQQAQAWKTAFAGIVESSMQPTSHTLAKQVYFPLTAGGYHLLAPLFPTSLVHSVHQRIREQRFGDSAKAAREARRDKQDWHEAYCEYPDLAIQHFGGTKPQNISQLNSERYGENWLLSSLPPRWQTLDVRAPLGAESIFDGWFSRRKSVRDAVRSLRDFLTRTSYNNLAIRRERARLVAEICDDAHQYAAHLRTLTPGWSADAECHLHEAEQLWLDPIRVHDDAAFMQRRLWGDWPQEVGHRFANWLNKAIRSDKLQLGEVEHRVWMDVLSKELKLFREVLEDDRH